MFEFLFQLKSKIVEKRSHVNVNDIINQIKV
jgi:hypothetical protein